MADLAAAYAGIPNDAQRLYRLVGAAYPGRDITVAAAGALAQLPDLDTGEALERLTAVELMSRSQWRDDPARYRLHGQAREHAREVGLDESAEARAAGLHGLVDWYRLACVAVAQICNPNRWYVGPDYDRKPIIDFGSERAALYWVDVERDNLEAVQRAAYDAGMYALVWQIVEGLWPWYTRNRMADDCIKDHALGLLAAGDDGNHRARARMLEGRAWGNLTKGNLHDAAQDAHDAMGLEEAEDHRVGQASVKELIALVHLKWGRPEAAAAEFLRAREMFLAADTPRGAAMMTRYLGRTSYAAGRFHEAVGHFREALAYFERIPERYQQTRILLHLARAQVRINRPDEAVDSAERALAIAQEIRSPLEEAMAHVQLADLAANGEAEQLHLDAARTLVDGLEGAEAEQIRRGVGL